MKIEQRKWKCFFKQVIFLSLFSGMMAASLSEVVYAASKESQIKYNDLLNKIKSKGTMRIILTIAQKESLASSLWNDEYLRRIQDQEKEFLQSISLYRPRLIRRFIYTPAFAMEVDEETLRKIIQNPDVVSIEEDFLVPPTLDDSIPLINADDVWQQGYTAEDQVVAILDSGVDQDHQMFAGKIVAEACFSSGPTSLCPNGQVTQTGPGSAPPCSEISGCDHGTHVAGIASGKNGNHSGVILNGVAKDANMIAIQVFSRFDDDSCSGNSPCILSYTSDWMAGLEYVLSLDSVYSAASANLSLGSTSTYQEPCDQYSAKTTIDQLKSAGIATVIASGNSSSSTGLSFPACISTAISVGNTQKDDTVRSSSNSADYLDLLAPGTSIDSAVPGNGYAEKTGTSMAAPHVTGAFAILRNMDSSLSVDEIADLLKTTGKPITDSRNGITKARIDFELIQTYTLSFSKEGTGMGSVTSHDLKINCGTTCFSQSASYVSGRTINLTAAAEAGSTFIGWNGPSCSGTSTNCSFQLFSDTILSAAFSKKFTDDSIQPGVTLLKAANIIEIRQALDDLRQLYQLSMYAWDFENPIANLSPISSDYITKLRDAIEQTRQDLIDQGQAIPSLPVWGESIMTGQTLIKAKHLQELRDAVEILRR